MYARGMSTRAIRDDLEELYGIEVSPDLISAVTSAVLEEGAEWQGRPLDACCPLVFLDAIWVTATKGSCGASRRGAIGPSPMASAVHIALGIQPDGTREVLGLWTLQTEGAEFLARG